MIKGYDLNHPELQGTIEPRCPTGGKPHYAIDNVVKPCFFALLWWVGTSTFVGTVTAFTQYYLGEILWVVCCVMLFFVWLVFGLMLPIVMIEGAQRVYGTLDPRGWLDFHNAYAIPRNNESILTIKKFCDESCESRYRIGSLYVFFKELDDATIFRLSR